MLDIQRITHESQTDATAWAGVLTAVTQHDLPGFPGLTERQGYLWLKHDWPGRRNEHYLARLDGEAVARLNVSLPTLDNLTNAYLDIEVVPAHRRKGIGRKLYELARQRVAANDRSTVVAASVETLPGLPAHDGGAGPAFATAMGLRSANLPEVIRRFDLSTADEGALEAMYGKAQAASAGYRLVQWDDAVPEEFVDDIAYLDSRLLEDAPMGDLAWEPEKVDAPRVRAIEASQRGRGRISFHTGAVHEESGRMVAWTCVVTDPEVTWHAWQGITIVEPRHRGHRLGALVKVANLHYMRAGSPAVTTVDTSNAAENSYMISINEDMGFRAKWGFQSWQRDLS